MSREARNRSKAASGGAVRIGAMLVLVALVGGALAAFGGRRSDSAAAVKLPRCARTTAKAGLPQALHRLPLPSGTSIQRARRNGPYTLVEGLLPGTLASATRFVQRRFPQAGFALGTGDSEPPYEADTPFAGVGYAGRIKLQSIFRCSGAVRLSIAVRPVF